MKTVMVLILLAVLAALAGAGVLMLRKSRDSDPQGKQMARALALRVGLSVALGNSRFVRQDGRWQPTPRAAGSP